MNRMLVSLTLCLVVSAATGQEPVTIGIIDFYGLRTISEEQVRAALPFVEGDSISPDLPFGKIELEMAEDLRVSRVELEPTCCPEPNVAILYVGLEETPSPATQYRAAPTRDVLLPPEIEETDREIGSALMAAIRAGDSGEDWSEGHAFSLNPNIRALQEKYVEYAELHREVLIDVLHNAARQRALAAQVLGYAADKRTVVPHLEEAVLDPEEDVRNNATRALALIAVYSNEHPELNIEIRPDVFIDMLNSVVGTDRGKASAVLWPLTESRDPGLLGKIRDKALASLIEMCGWKAEGHATLPCIILERVVGLPEQDELHPKETTIAMARELLRQQEN